MSNAVTPVNIGLSWHSRQDTHISKIDGWYVVVCDGTRRYAAVRGGTHSRITISGTFIQNPAFFSIICASGVVRDGMRRYTAVPEGAPVDFADARDSVYMINIKATTELAYPRSNLRDVSARVKCKEHVFLGAPYQTEYIPCG